jgi:hypothetical protein
LQAAGDVCAVGDMFASGDVRASGFRFTAVDEMEMSAVMMYVLLACVSLNEVCAMGLCVEHSFNRKDLGPTWENVPLRRRLSSGYVGWACHSSHPDGGPLESTDPITW